MASAPRDNNRVPVAQFTLNSDGVTPIPVRVNPTDHSLKVENDTTGASLPYVNAERDDNRVPALWAVSSADGLTPIPVYVDSNGMLLIDSS